jgi:N-carbamoylputrescine amidase
MRAALLSLPWTPNPLDTEAQQVIKEVGASGADLLCLPHLSFLPYFPSVRDRAGLEFAERPPAASLRRALGLVDCYVAGSVYESEGEGVFYCTAYLGRRQSLLLRYRQRAVEAVFGRYEQMYWSPGHDGYVVAAAELGRVGLLIGADLRSPEAYQSLAKEGATLIIGGASEKAGLWEQTAALARAMASVHGVSVLVVNREGPDEEGEPYPGGSVAVDERGRPLPQDDSGLYEVGVNIHV